MKTFTAYLYFLLAISCGTKKHKVEEAVQPGPVSAKAIKQEREFSAVDISTHMGIINRSKRRIFLMYNSTENRFPVIDSAHTVFETECMACGPVQQFDGHLVFARRLVIFQQKSIYYQNDLPIPGSASTVKKYSSGGPGELPVRFRFSNGTGSIAYIKESCNDAGLNTVTLKYPEGTLVIKDLLNPTFFEFDLDGNGISEQYLLATRNCTQELAILKIE